MKAELPSSEDEPALYDVIKRHNIHGPCGTGVNESSPCMIDGKCSKRYPKAFSNDETTILADSSVVYQRRDEVHGGFTFQLRMKGNRMVTVDNRSVVPYNPILSLMFDTHINVEIVNTVSSVKYLYKYTFKGVDRSVFKVVARDEVEMFLTGRYIGSSEAFWRIFSFETVKKYPPVMKLAIHLPLEQLIFFSDEEDLECRLTDGPPATSLTAFFELNKVDALARQLLYSEIPFYYIFDKSGKNWRRRKLTTSRKKTGAESDMIGRIPAVGLNAKQKELFFLRILLHHVRGPTGYDDLKTVDGTLLPTFQQACIARGLFSDDNEAYEVCLVHFWLLDSIVIWVVVVC